MSINAIVISHQSSSAPPTAGTVVVASAKPRTTQCACVQLNHLAMYYTTHATSRLVSFRPAHSHMQLTLLHRRSAFGHLPFDKIHIRSAIHGNKHIWHMPQIAMRFGDTRASAVHKRRRRTRFTSMQPTHVRPVRLWAHSRGEAKRLQQRRQRLRCLYVCWLPVRFIRCRTRCEGHRTAFVNS